MRTTIRGLSPVFGLLLVMGPEASVNVVKGATGLDSYLYQAVSAKSNRLITAQAAGPVRLGMTIAEARRSLSGFTLSRTSDGEGLVLIAVKGANQTVMTLFAGETNPEAPINERARIEFIEVWDESYSTAAGVHPNMPLRETAGKYGELQEIMRSEIESREFATFARQPKGIQLRVMAEDGMAGVYGAGENTTARYSPSAYVFSISISSVKTTPDANESARELANAGFTKKAGQLRRHEGESLQDFAARIVPPEMELAHPAIEGAFGPSAKGIVILFNEKSPANSYEAWVLVPEGEDYQKHILPKPEFTWSIEEPKAIFFANADRDRERELLILAECYTGIGPTGAQPFNRTRVYDWTGGGFRHLEALSDKIGTAKTARAARRKLL